LVVDAVKSVGVSDSLAERLRNLEADKQDAGEHLKAAQSRFTRLLGQVTLRPKDCELWAYPTHKKQKGLPK